MTEQVLKTIKNLKKNNMDVFYAESKEQALKTVEEILVEGKSVAVGGSMTLNEIGAMELLRSGKYNFYDRYAANSEEERQKIMKSAFTADFFMCSSNAITENGELYNVDGFANRISAILYGPETVIIVAGVNKIVANLKEAELRVKQIAAPKNTVRLEIPTYCNKTGHCVALDNGNVEMCSGCASGARICCNYLVSAAQRVKGRIKVILVNESLGY